MKTWIVIAMTGLFCLPALGSELKDYPQQINGKTRVAITLPKVADEHNYKVEIILARDLEKSDCNYKGLSGKLEAKRTADYAEYLEVNSDGGYSATRMGCFQEPKPETIFGTRVTISYQSHSPIIVYVTDLVYVQYRILKAEGPFTRP